MKALIALALSAFMLNMSVHAGSATQYSDKTPPDSKKNIEGYEAEWKKQQMEDSDQEVRAREQREGRTGFEKSPYPYRDDQPAQERVQTED